MHANVRINSKRAMARTTAKISAPATTLADGSAIRRRLWLALFGIGLLIAGALAGEAIRATTAPPGPHVLGQDLLPGYIAGRMVAAGRYRELYNVDAVAQSAALVMREADLAGDPGHAAWMNPPFYSGVFV